MQSAVLGYLGLLLGCLQKCRTSALKVYRRKAVKRREQHVEKNLLWEYIWFFRGIDEADRAEGVKMVKLGDEVLCC